MPLVRALRALLPALALVSAAAPAAAQADSALERARKLLRSTPLIDGHNDLPWAIREVETAPRDVARYDLRGQVPGHTDLARLRAGMVGAQFWTADTPGCSSSRSTSPGE